MRDLGLLVMRLIVGGIFVVHGYPKLFGGPGSSERLHPLAKRHLGENWVDQMERGSIKGWQPSVERLGLPFPGVMVWVGALSQFLGGILLILGWLTKPASLALGVNMVLAITKVHWKGGLVGRGGYEFPLVLLAAVIALWAGGPGALSIDGDSND
jgi:putative oxidoreductase